MSDLLTVKTIEIHECILIKIPNTKCPLKTIHPEQVHQKLTSRKIPNMVSDLETTQSMDNPNVS